MDIKPGKRANRPSIFISYSHADESWKDIVVKQLRVLESEGDFEVWDDRRIVAGDDWYREIEAALNDACVAILLISADFLTSRFIQSEEVPRLLERRKEEGLWVIPLIVLPCAWDYVSWLKGIQARPKDGRSLSGGSEHQICEDLRGLTVEVAELIRAQSVRRPFPPELASLKELFGDLPEDVLRPWCHEAMPPRQPHAIPSGAGSLGLLQWLVEMTNPAGGQVPLLIVLKKLRDSLSDPHDRDSLDQCINQVRRYFGIDDRPIELTPAPVNRSESPGLMLEISPPRGNRCNVEILLFFDPDNVFSVCVREGTTALNLDDPAELQDFVTELREIISEREVDETKVIIEFFLPTELQARAVEQWEDEFRDPLGIWFPVVVRSRERLRNRRRRWGWRNNWKTLRMHWNDPLSSRLWPYEASLRSDVPDKLREGVCFALSFVPNLEAPTEQNAMLYLLRNGAPVALWPRRNDCLEGMIQQLCQHSGGKPLRSLPQIICAMRRELRRTRCENTPCYHLALLWDDPSRLPPVKLGKDDELLQAPS